jgi:hypothetical protein
MSFSVDADSGQYEWVQVLNSAVIDTYTATGLCEKTTEGLDGPGPYGVNAAINDSPGVGLSSQQEVTVSDSFSMWLMYSPSPSDVWVPLFEIDWTWAADATYNGTSWSLKSAGSGGAQPSIKRTSSYPKWTQRANPVAPCNPKPAIINISPNAGAVGGQVTITGTSFGAAQGITSVVAFGGTAATVTNWSQTSIAAVVPVGATTGNVVVTVNGMNSNSANFTVE